MLGPAEHLPAVPLRGFCIVLSDSFLFSKVYVFITIEIELQWTTEHAECSEQPDSQKHTAA